LAIWFALLSTAACATAAVGAGKGSDRQARQAHAEQELAEATQSANKACGTKIVTSVKWNSINDEALSTLSISSYCGEPLSAMTELCESKTAQSYFSSNVGKLICQFGPAMKLELASGTMTWTTEKDAANAGEYAKRALVGSPSTSTAEAPAFGKGVTLAESLALEKTSLCSDGKAHYAVIVPDGQSSLDRLYYGDGKLFYRVPTEPALGNYFLEPRRFNKTANSDFRGLDVRLYSSVELERDKNRCLARCGDRETPLALVEGEQARSLLLAAAWRDTPQRYRPHALLRDKSGVYYYVDSGYKETEANRFRLFRGRKGSLKELKMTNVVSDSEGEIFSTHTGSLRLILDRTKPPAWTESGKTTTLKAVPVNENLMLIYNELGIYDGLRLGNPCDDL
jgi:hypothetical protein